MMLMVVMMNLVSIDSDSDDYPTILILLHPSENHSYREHLHHTDIENHIDANQFLATFVIEVDL